MKPKIKKKNLNNEPHSRKVLSKWHTARLYGAGRELPIKSTSYLPWNFTSSLWRPGGGLYVLYLICMHPEHVNSSGHGDIKSLLWRGKGLHVCMYLWRVLASNMWRFVLCQVSYSFWSSTPGAVGTNIKKCSHFRSSWKPPPPRSPAGIWCK